MRRLIAPLQRAKGRLARIERLQAAGRRGKARVVLRRALRDLRLFRDRLAVRGDSTSTPAREALGGLVERIRVELQALAGAGEK